MTSALIAVRLLIGVMKMNEIIEMPYGTGKSLTTQELYDIYKALTAELLLCAEAKAIIEDFMKKNSEVQLDVEIDEEDKENESNI